MGSKSRTARANLVVGQSGGPTAVINCSLVGVVEESLGCPQIASVLGLVNGIEGALQENLLDLGRQPRDLLQGLLQTPASALGSCRRKLGPADYRRILQVFEAHDVGYFLYIGGNDSMDTAQRVASLAAAEGYDLQAVGIPKTVDNDLEGTDHCPGYPSVARYVAQAVMDVARDLQAMRTFMQGCVLEVMGRNAGWIAAAASLASRRASQIPLVLCLPEQPFDRADFLQKVAQTREAFGYVVVVTSQAVRTRVGCPESNLGTTLGVDAFGHPMLAGAGDYLAGLMRAELGLPCWSIRPSTIQRSAMPCVSRVDQGEALEVGRAAVRLAVEGGGGRMVTLVRSPGMEYRCSTGAVGLDLVANRERAVPAEYLEPYGVSSAFRAYAEPLLGDPLPDYATLEPLAVAKRCGPA